MVRGYSVGKHTWTVHVIERVECATESWLFIGVHNNPNQNPGNLINNSGYYLNSYRHPGVFGVTVNTTSNCYIYTGGGTSIRRGEFVIEIGDILIAELDCFNNLFTLKHHLNSWKPGTVELPPGKTWYPHFNNFSVNFKILK